MIMNKLYIILLLLGVSACLSAQIGVNTSNPQVLFHIDPKQNNNATGIPTLVQTEDDIVITQNGFMGIGTITPETKLDIRKHTSTDELLFIDNGGALIPNQYLISDSQGNTLWSSVFASWFAYMSNAPSIDNKYPDLFLFENYSASGISEAGVGSINSTNGTIAVPYSGIYKLTCSALWGYRRSVSYEDKYKVGLLIERTTLSGISSDIWNPTSIGATSSWGISPVFSNIIFLNAGDVLSMYSDQRFMAPYTNDNAPVANSCINAFFLVEYLQ